MGLTGWAVRLLWNSEFMRLLSQAVFSVDCERDGSELLTLSELFRNDNSLTCYNAPES